MSIRIDGTNTTANPGITGTDTDTGLQFGTDEVKVVTGGSDRVTVDSAGRIGVNQSSPARILHVGSSGTAEANVRIEGGADYFEFRLKDSDNALTIHKNIADAGSSEAVRILSGGGITFNGDTAQVNALDDYEEGTWTAGLDCANNKTGSVSYSNQTGDYIKIGRLCFLTINLGVSSSTLGGGNLLLTGLPFPARSENARRGGFLISYTTIWTGVSSAGQVTLRTETNSTESRFNYHTGNLNTTSEPGGGNISSSGGALFISGCYEVE
jgi:hypothetical protein